MISPIQKKFQNPLDKYKKILYTVYVIYKQYQQIISEKERW